MATVTGGVSYGLYTVAKRYVMPLISPPTPPQLEQDKAAIDASFSRAFSLIDQLATDTAALKSAEESRTEGLDSALQEVEAVISELKAANKRREDDSRRIGDEVRGLKEMIPKALEGWKAAEDIKLKELGAGLKSLKILVGNRVGGDQSTANAVGRPSQFSERTGANSSNTPRGSASQALPYTAPSYSLISASEMQDENSAEAPPSSAPAPAPGVNVPKREVTSPFKFDQRSGSRAAIPAWQMAAASNSKATKIPAPEPAKVDGSAEGSEASVDT
ncbi:peroxisomal membrane protein pex14 [Xylographa opegraphella]|nr:peroxisomal membrane protein pex14 [Xylographa opegraphella]